MKTDICPVSKYCGGCNYQGVDYSEQLIKKQKYIDSLLKGFGKPLCIIGMDDPKNYRNKVQVSFAKDHKNKVYAGNYIASTHTVVPISDCMIADEKAIEIINSIVRLINKYKISIFDERVFKGCMRHVLIRCTNKNEYMVVLVTGSFNINKKEDFIKDLLKYNPFITTIIQNHNNKHTSMVLGDKSIVLYGKGNIVDNLCDNDFVISPNSFYQINKRQTEVLYTEAIKLAKLNKKEVLIDAYCGTGTIGIVASKYVKEVIGVELNSNAIKDAYKNAKKNNIKNISFYNEDAGKFMTELAKEKDKIDVVIMDPPRSGADKKFLSSLINLKPKKIIYISCGPESLKSNLVFMTRYNYKVETIQPIDMFPYTNHVETIVYLKLKKELKNEKSI